jgi:hypothetical protein
VSSALPQLSYCIWGKLKSLSLGNFVQKKIKPSCFGITPAQPGETGKIFSQCNTYTSDNHDCFIINIILLYNK